MFKDNSSFNNEHRDIMSLKMKALDDVHSVHMTGEVIDKIYKKGVLVDTIIGHNLVVNSFVRLVMSLIKNQSGYKGATYWAVGSGSSSWDESLPDPEINEVKLTSELGRLPIPPENIVFLDEAFEETSSPTNIVQITLKFNEEDCNGEWREFAIFGGNATSTPNSGLMLNKRHHKVITKTEDMTIERTIRFTLNLV